MVRCDFSTGLPRVHPFEQHEFAVDHLGPQTPQYSEIAVICSRRTQSQTNLIGTSVRFRRMATVVRYISYCILVLDPRMDSLNEMKIFTPPPGYRVSGYIECPSIEIDPPSSRMLATVAFSLPVADPTDMSRRHLRAS